MKILKNLTCNIMGLFMRKLFVLTVVFVSLLLIKLRTCLFNLYDLCKLVLLPNNYSNNHTSSKKGVDICEEI